ncbi:hypothetical protein AFM12_17010 [Jiulongibacter sediminis]|uniref:Uncharacterized protein n=2 Tax=Jiulongibacter sediminis TaxID=1605367 RepID=A0A0P7BZ87_9BACT|nr:hypothetical protein AFM12_17010 [Jiulongibacter sediminis]TBX22280.1 hypothetical protein TK44_17020 [Jiulongibacter sediminis]
MRRPKTVEELLQENRPNEYRALVNHEKYLVIDKVGGKNRRKRFIGEEFNFRNDFGARFYGQLTAVTDSTFSLTYFDQTMQKNVNRMFYLNEVDLIFKRNLKPGIEYKFNPLMFLPFAFDWIYFKRPPWQSTGSLALLAGIEVGRVMIGNRQKFYNRIRINEKNRLLVFQY